MTEHDDVFAIHSDFTERTQGRPGSLNSKVGEYLLDIPLCMETLRRWGWDDGLRKRLAQNRVAAADVRRSLEVEMLRRLAVRELIERIRQESTSAPVPQHKVVELLTGWVIHERNDPSHQAAVGRLRRQDGKLWSENLKNDLLQPAQVWRTQVLPQDVGSRVRCKKGRSRRVYLLSGLVNAWRGKLTLVEDSDEKGEPALDEEELKELELVVAKEHVLDILIPSPDLEARGSSTAVYVRVMNWCEKRTDLANAASNRITDIARLVRQGFLAKVAALQTRDSIQTPRLQHISISELQTKLRGGGETAEIVEMTFGALRCPILKRAWLKMRELYEATCSEFPSRSGAPDQNSTAEDDEASERTQRFATRLLTVLLRYASLSGATVEQVDQTSGFHAAVPPIVYAQMRRRLHCAMEGFASPMNSTSPYFCSLFPDCDSYFGSLGSFFELDVRQHMPKGCSFSCNPPYSVIVMTQVAEQLNKMFTDANALQVPLQVFVVVCNWGSFEGGSGAKILQSLKSNPSCVRHISIGASEAPFSDGHSFVLNRPYFTLGSNTEVFLYQNETANSLWPGNRSTEFDAVIATWKKGNVAEDATASQSTGEKRKRGRED